MNNKLTIATYFYNDFDVKKEKFFKNIDRLKSKYEFQVLVINNGGKKFTINNPNIKLINLKQNLKPGGAKREAILNCKTEYIWIVDSDDDFNLHENLFKELRGNAIRPQGKYKSEYAFSWSYIFRVKYAIDKQLLNGWDHWYEENEFKRVFGDYVNFTEYAQYIYYDDDRPFSENRNLSEIDSMLWILDDFENRGKYLGRSKGNWKRYIKYKSNLHAKKSRMSPNEKLKLNKLGKLKISLFYRILLKVGFFK